MREIMGKRRTKEAYKPPVLLTAPLQSGANMPLLGLGTWKSKPGEVRAAVLYAITSAGYRHIDCAAIYENEGEVGSALEEVFAKWDIKREDLFITTKLWNNDHASARVEPALRKCLKLLKLDYVDAFLIHWPITGVRSLVMDIAAVACTRLTRALSIPLLAAFLRRLLIHATDAGGGAVCVRDAAAGTAPWSEELRAAVEARGAVEAAVKATPQSRAKPRQPALA